MSVCSERVSGLGRGVNTHFRINLLARQYSCGCGRGGRAWAWRGRGGVGG